VCKTRAIALERGGDVMVEIIVLALVFYVVYRLAKKKKR